MNTATINKAFLWQKAKDFPEAQGRGVLYKHDLFLENIETLFSYHKAWGPISGTTKRVESENKLLSWISAQNSRLRNLVTSHGLPDYEVLLSIDDFPANPGRQGTRVITTSPNIAYLIDETSDFLTCVGNSFGWDRARVAQGVLNESIGTFLYVTNSVEAGGRAFSGDPFTGQVAAYSRIFTYDLLGNRVLNLVCYYPHQLYSQFYNIQKSQIIHPNNKGVRMLMSQANLLITAKGVLLEPHKWELLGND